MCISKYIVRCRCTSLVGFHIRRNRTCQPVSLRRNCVEVKPILHEIFHALGRYHEQARKDRDQYVKVYEENIIPGECDAATRCGCILVKLVRIQI